MIDPKEYKLHVFDLDDTLVNTRYSYTIAQERAVCDTFPHITPEKISALMPDLRWICQQFGSGNVTDYMSAFLNTRPDLFTFDSKLLQLIVDRYRQTFAGEFGCFNGALAYLQHLKKMGKTIALVSNGSVESQLKKLRSTGLHVYFTPSLCFISADYPPNLKKPSPHMLEQACQSADALPKETIFYGNSVGDVLAGNLAGVTTVHFSGSTPLPENLPEIARPDYSIESWIIMVG